MHTRIARIFLAGLVAIGFAFAVWRGSLSHVYLTSDSSRTIAVANAIATGRERWGLVDYTHHPQGSAYVLVPIIKAGYPDLVQRVPLLISCLTTAAALAVLLSIAPWSLWPGTVALFAALLWQPGYINWTTDVWQHSWNMSLAFVLMALGCAVARATPWLFLAGYLGGWIGYDFIFVQVATVFAVRVAFRSRTRLRTTLVAVADETIAFVCGVAAAFLSHLIQNTLYFSSATVAVEDLLSSVFTRANNSNVNTETIQARWDGLRVLAPEYIRLFLSPDWSHLPSLGAAGLLFLVGICFAWRSARRRGLSLSHWIVGCAAAVSGIVIWWIAAPGHALPHTFLFPRMLFVPLFGIVAVTIRVLSAVPPTAAPSFRIGLRHLVTGFLVVALTPNVLRWAGERVDRRFYDHIWTSTDCAPRLDLIGAPFVPATSNQKPGPTLLKSGTYVVGGVNGWGVALVDHRWEPAPGEPWTYETHFNTPARVSDIAMRAYGPPQPHGALRAFRIELLGAPQPTIVDQHTPGLEVTDIGYLRGYHFHFDQPLEANGLRLVVTDADGTPVITDLLAFGHPEDPSGVLD